jgi:hypothetical protein
MHRSLEYVRELAQALGARAIAPAEQPMGDRHVKPLGEVDPVNPVEGAVVLEMAVGEMVERSVAAGGKAIEVGVVLGGMVGHHSTTQGAFLLDSQRERPGAHPPSR